jgi:hypothetical protein
LDKCRDMGRVNGGVMVINPSPRLFAEYKAKIVDVVQRNCKYPNETLFEYVNNDYFNLPVQYNLSHYHAQPTRLQSYQLDPGDIFVYHFNETDYKHIDIIKNPIDEKGDNWLELIDRQPKYVIRKLPILHYKRSVFDRYRMVIEPLMIEATRPKVVKAKVSETPVKAKVVEKPVADKVVEKPVADKVADKPVVEKPVAEKPVSDKPVAEKPVAEKVIVNPKIPSPDKKEKCPKGTRRNKKTGLCEPYAKGESKASLPKAESKAESKMESKASLPKYPKGTRRNRRTGICEPKIVPLQLELIQAKQPKVEVKQLARCPKGTHRNKKTGECDPVQVLDPKK